LFNWIASFLRISLKAQQEKLRAKVFLDLSEIAQKKIFNQKYDFFLTEKSEDISSKIVLNLARVSENFIRPIIQIASGICNVFFIFIALTFFSKSNALYLIISLLFGYFLISFLVTPLIKEAKKQRIALEYETNKNISDDLITIIDVHLTESEYYFQNKYSIAGKKAFPYLWKGELFQNFQGLW